MDLAFLKAPQIVRVSLKSSS